ncbi:MAG: hypothetical protein RLZZ600_594 [Actinomycetota bacterium]
MSNDQTPWHSDDELASALERALEIPTDGVGDTGQAYDSQAGAPRTAPNDFSDLFAALSERVESQVTATEAAPAAEIPAVEVPAFDAPAATESAPEIIVEPERVYESLDDFKPRTNFIPVVTPEADAENSAPVQSSSVPVTSAHVTQPIRWDRKRPTFDEIIFGTATIAESN